MQHSTQQYVLMSVSAVKGKEHTLLKHNGGEVDGKVKVSRMQFCFHTPTQIWKQKHSQQENDLRLDTEIISIASNLLCT